jgi:hypothetical protein
MLSLSPRYSHSIRALISDIGIPLLFFSQACGLTSKETLLWWSGRNGVLKYSHIRQLSNYLGVSEEQILQKTYNKKLLRRRIFESKIALPEVYDENAESYVISSAYIIEYLRLLYGQVFVDTMLQKLNIHPCFFDEETRKINILFIVDLLNLCKKFGFQTKDFRSLASSMFLSVEKSKISKIFKPTDSYEEAYHMIDASSKYFDANFEYDFTIRENSVTIKSTPRDHTLRLLDKHEDHSSFLYDYRALIFQAMPTLCKLSSLNSAHKSKCISMGNSHSVYELDFPSTKNLIFFSHF